MFHSQADGALCACGCEAVIRDDSPDRVECDGEVYMPGHEPEEGRDEE